MAFRIGSVSERAAEFAADGAAEFVRYDNAFGAAVELRQRHEVEDDEWASGPVLWERRFTSAGWDWVRVGGTAAKADVGAVTCDNCGGTGADPGSLYEPEPCALCLGAGELLPDELEGTVFYDHTNQAWVLDGKYVSCGHGSSDCGCWAKLHHGEAFPGDRRAA